MKFIPLLFLLFAANSQAALIQSKKHEIIINDALKATELSPAGDFFTEVGGSVFFLPEEIFGSVTPFAKGIVTVRWSFNAKVDAPCLLDGTCRLRVQSNANAFSTMADGYVTTNLGAYFQYLTETSSVGQVFLADFEKTFDATDFYQRMGSEVSYVGGIQLYGEGASMQVSMKSIFQTEYRKAERVSAPSPALLYVACGLILLSKRLRFKCTVKK